jgi:hypothetical protein
MKNYCFIKIVKIVVCVSIALLGFTYVVMKLWNGLIPELFNGPVLSFCQALGLLLLCKIFFGGLGKWGGCGGGCGGGFRNRSQWRSKFEEKIAGMSPEEKEKFKNSFRGMCRSKWGADCDTNEDAKHGH